MKKYLSNLSAVVAGLAIVAFTVTACKKDENKDNAPKSVEQVADATIYSVDAEASSIDWKGYKVLKSENTSHFGTMKFSEGEVGVKDNQITSGKFTADLTSIKNTDLADNQELAKQLEDHLKSADFFEVEKFPTATFEITKVTPAEQGDFNSVLEGNLTIKGITKSVSFKANVKVENEQVSIATEQTDINRNEFDVKFQSPIENGIIKDEITLQIMLKANLKK